MDFNVYVRRSPATGELLLIYTIPNSLQTADELRAKHPEFEQSSRSFDNYFGPLFQGERLSRFDLLPEFPAAESAAPLPESIRAAVGWPSELALSPGAFPRGR